MTVPMWLTWPLGFSLLAAAIVLACRGEWLLAGSAAACVLLPSAVGVRRDWVAALASLRVPLPVPLPVRRPRRAGPPWEAAPRPAVPSLRDTAAAVAAARVRPS